MPSSQRGLQSSPIPTTPPPQFSSSSSSSSTAAESLSVDSDVVVILAALLCALICVVGLALVARCAWLRRSSSSPQSPLPPPPAKGLKKKVIKSLPKVLFTRATGQQEGGEYGRPSSSAAAECAICLADFAEGEELRALPQCGHRFHVACVDTWLAAHSSCPSCRQVLVVVRCDRCGARSSALDCGDKPLHQGHASNFLP